MYTFCLILIFMGGILFEDDENDWGLNCITISLENI